MAMVIQNTVTFSGYNVKMASCFLISTAAHLSDGHDVGVRVALCAALAVGVARVEVVVAVVVVIVDVDILEFRESIWR